jgi:hypothetical protein
MNIKEIYRQLGITSGTHYLSSNRGDIAGNLNSDSQGKLNFRPLIIELIQRFYDEYSAQIKEKITQSGNPFTQEKSKYI